MAYRKILLMICVTLIPVYGADSTPQGALLKVNCRMKGKLYVGETLLGNVERGYQYPVNNLKAGTYIVKIIGEEATWQTTVEVQIGKPAVIESDQHEPKTVASTDTPAQPTTPVKPPTTPVKPPIDTTPVKPTPMAVKENRSAWTVPDIKLTLINIQPGTFKMGDAKGSDFEKPVHSVQLTKQFWMGKTEVTAAQVKAILPKLEINGATGNQPAINISWWEAMDFCNKLTERERAKLPAGYAFRLPTEAEWEYCYRAGTTTRYFSGELPDSLKQHAASGRAIADVGGTKPNPWGLYDMVGNVQEWCLDAIPSRPRSAPKTYVDGIADPVEMKGPARVVRGGHYASSLSGQYAAYRKPFYPIRIYRALGFRVVLAPDLKEPSEGRAPRRRYK